LKNFDLNSIRTKIDVSDINGGHLSLPPASLNSGATAFCTHGTSQLPVEGFS